MKNRILLTLCFLFILGVALPASANVNQHCTVGFYKNHSQFLNSGPCANNVFNKDTLVSSVFPNVDACVGALTFLQLLLSPTTVCGDGSTFAGAEVILLRQAIVRLANAGNSSPAACNALAPFTNKTNTTIDDAIATDNRNLMTGLAGVFDSLNQGSCTLH
jgi:hypothetical protein